ncbi:hypothetical protein E3P96_03223 [Wallemia ichthyophaga]|nr:hypothetical protein E3P96_03223 [Wallemia ichthyophaga]
MQSSSYSQLDLGDLDRLSNQLTAFRRSLSGKLMYAEGFHGTLSALDTQQQRLSASLDMVRKTELLQSSLRLLDMAIDERDYDQASLYAQRALNIPHSIITSQFADTVVPSTHHPEPPLQRLDNSLDTLNEIFISHFNQASQSLDQAEISRFFKLFPKINRKQDGITAYSYFVVKLIQRKFKGGMDSLDSLRALLDSIASVLEDHQPVVHKYYGSEYMVTVLHSLLAELDDKANVIFLNWTRNLSTLENGEMKHINTEISEISGLASHWAAFKLFIMSNLNTDDSMKHLLSSSTTAHLLRQHINDTYIPLEMAYFKSTMKEALEANEIDEDALPYTSSILEDTFYIYKGLLDRLVGCGDVSVLKNAVDGIIRVFQQSFIEKMQMDFDNNIKPRTSKMIAQQSKVGGSTAGSRSKALKIAVCLNNLDICSEYNMRILSDLPKDSNLHRFYDPENIAPVKDQLLRLKEISDHVQTSLTSCLNTLFATTFKNPIKDCLKTSMDVTNYDKNADAQSKVFVTMFEREWSAVFDKWNYSLTANNFDEVFIKSTTHLIQLWENFVLNSHTLKFSVSGAIQFEKDVYGLLGYLSGLSNVGIRELFSRIRQISSVLNEQGSSTSRNYWKITASEISTLKSMKLANDSL